jgi:secretion/DNA translocation related CpaE-like protein
MVSDPDLLDAVLRLAAAAGCELQRAVDPPQARAFWNTAPLVLLDAAAAAQCARAGLPRRGEVVLAVRGEPQAAVWRHAVAVGAEHVVALPEAEQWLVAALTDAAEGPRPGGSVLAVIGGRGGAGASVFAAAVAVTAVREGARALLVDCDPLGGGLDLVLGAEDLGGLRWPGVGVEGGRVPAAALHAALPSPRIGRRDGELGVLSCDRSTHGPTPAAVRAVVEAGRRAGDTVVCDLPRYPTDASVAALSVADLVALVVPADVRSCAAGARVAARLGQHMRPEPGLARTLERGEAPPRPRGPLAGAARAVLAEMRAASGARS